MLIVKINNDCILVIDFLKLFNLQNIFDFIFLNSFAENNANFDYYRIEHVVTVPSSLIRRKLSLFK